MTPNKPLSYLIGDATSPVGQGRKFIVHVVNDIGAWGAGFVLALSAKWKNPEVFYRRWSQGKYSYPPFELGEVQFVYLKQDILVVNLLAQHGLRGKNNPKPLNYDGLRSCLSKLVSPAKKMKASIHMPRIGSGLGGGSWDIVENIIIDELSNKGIQVYVYSLPDK
jgi:O-acetyl-ADP-ribose deacetylase (regulator of RNase III)